MKNEESDPIFVVPRSSETDKYSYRCLTLTNGMKVCLVSAAGTDKCAVAMDVLVGSLLDPREVMGLAHFCEHMVFMGSEKYKEENLYSKYLSQNNGKYNAFTSSERTNFFFQIKSENLFETIDIFAQFFISPLFTESATERELLAVNSEHEKNICIDIWRIIQLDRHLSDSSHDYNKFGTGNLQTLKEDPALHEVNVRQALLDFHSKYYSANIMSLCVLGKESLESLQDMVIDLFSSVPNKNAEVPYWINHPWTESHLKQMVYIYPVRDCFVLYITWPISDYRKYYKSKPEGYVSHLIGHEGCGSILSLLKKKGWANNLSIGPNYIGNGFGNMFLQIELFEEGIDHIDEILTIVYQYIAILKSSEPQEWIFNEQKKIKEMQFRFKENSNLERFVSKVSHDMRVCDAEEVLEGPYLMTEFRPDLIKEIISGLSATNMRVFCCAKKFESICCEEEYWYKTKYIVENIPEDKIQKWQSIELNKDLYFPRVNPYISTDFSIKPPSSENGSTPDLLKDTDLSRWWFLKDSYYLLPKGFIFIHFFNNLSIRDPLAQVMNYLIADLFTNAVNEEIYDAMLANLEFSMSAVIDGFKIQFTGYNEKIPLFIGDLITKLITFSPDLQQFESIKENRFRIIRNFEMDGPLSQGDKFLSCFMSEVMWTPEELMSTFNDITIDTFKGYFKLFFSKFFTEGFVYGNFHYNDVVNIMTDVDNIFKNNSNPKPLLKSQMAPLREVLLPENSNYMFHFINKHQPTSALVTYLQGLPQTTITNVITQLCDSILSEPIFNQLRTEEQLGYIVGCNVRISNSMQGHRIYLQSDKKPGDLDTRVNIFLATFHNVLIEMPNEEFHNYILALKNKILERPKDMMQQANKVWQEIASQHYDFARDSKEVDELMKMTKDDIIKYYDAFLHPTSTKIKKFSIYVTSEKTHGGDHSFSDNNNQTIIEDLARFKKNQSLSSLVEPLLPKVKEVPLAKL